MFFQKKKREGSPVDEVQRLTASGLSDKDVIKKLKSEGYSYEQIEQAMMQAVKQGVSPNQSPFQNYQPQQNYPQPAPQGSIEDVYSKDTEEEPMQFPELEVPAQQEGLDISPEAIVEELVEGVVEEKWQKFQQRIEKTESEISKMKIMLEQHKESTVQAAPDVGPRVNEMSEQLDDLQARVGGLEKAFKQFLPSLTQNIDSLSKMIHEMKQKQHGMELRA